MLPIQGNKTIYVSSAQSDYMVYGFNKIYISIYHLFCCILNFFIGFQTFSGRVRFLVFQSAAFVAERFLTPTTLLAQNIILSARNSNYYKLIIF